MTREKTKKCIEVMQAYVNGKEMEYEVLEDEDNLYIANDWPNWNWELCKYRIKEAPKPFDWRGKNIQWVRDHLYTRKVISVMDTAGVLTITAICYQDKDAPKPVVYLHSWRELIEDEMEWSEDNATWRKFE